MGQKRPIKVEPLNLLGTLKKTEKKEEHSAPNAAKGASSSSSMISDSKQDDSKKSVGREINIELAHEESPVVVDNQSGKVQRVYESENHYHLSSTKAATAVGGDSEGSGEFKLIKQDKYLENRESPREDYSTLFSLILKSSNDGDLDVMIDQICSPEADAILDEELPEIFTNFDLNEEEK